MKSLVLEETCILLGLVSFFLVCVFWSCFPIFPFYKIGCLCVCGVAPNLQELQRIVKGKWISKIQNFKMQKKCSENSQNWVNHDKNASKAKKIGKCTTIWKERNKICKKWGGKAKCTPPLQFLSDQIFTLTNPLQAEQYQTTQTLFLQKGNHQKYIHITKKWNIGLIHVGREWTHNDFGWFWLLCDIQPGSLS